MATRPVTHDSALADTLSVRTELAVEDAVEIVRLLETAQIDVVVDGGWAVDALLGRQSRSHADLDIAVPHSSVPRSRELLEEHGFNEIPRKDSWACNFVLADNRGRQVDVHSYTFDPDGRNVYGVAYPFESLAGKGTIGGYPVRCISAEWLLKFHTNYTPDEDDYHDVKLLCEHFGLTLPVEYEHFERADSRARS